MKIITRIGSCSLPVEVVEKAQEVEAELDEALLLVLSQSAEDLCGIEHVFVVHDPKL